MPEQAKASRIRSVLIVAGCVAALAGIVTLALMRNGSSFESASSQQAPSDAPNAAPQAAPIDAWAYNEPVDQVTGNTAPVADRQISLVTGSFIQIFTECDPSNDPVLSTLKFHIRFFDKDKNPLSIDQSSTGVVQRNVFQSIVVGGSVRGSFQQGHEDQIPFSLKHDNDIEIQFPAHDSIMGHGIEDSKLIKFEVPLTNGETPLIDLHLADTELQRAIEKCFVPVSKIATSPKSPVPSGTMLATRQPASDQSTSDSSAPARENQ